MDFMDAINNLAEKVEALEKEIAELKVQVSAQPELDIDQVAKEFIKRLERSSAFHNP